MKYPRIYKAAAVALTLLFTVDLCGAPNHPRLFLKGGEERALVRNIAADEGWSRMHADIVAECDTICELAPMERILEGPRLHAVSCEVLRRVFFLSYAYRTEQEKRYAERAVKEMLAVCQFSDWNPKHFLDVAEMTTALAIGYDWLYDLLDKETRRMIEESILNKGLLPSEVREYHYPFMIKESRYSNWGQVCHGGMAIGALAVMDRYPEVAERIVTRSRERILLPMMKAYPPGGCYPEGFGYWAFGTQYNVLLIAALESVFGEKDVENLKRVPGFIASGDFSQQLITPTLHTFGYSDNSTRLFLEPLAMWFNAQDYNPALFYMQKRLFEKLSVEKSYVKGIKNRLIPAMVIWGAGTGRKPEVSLDDAELPTTHFYIGRGENSVCVMRNGWEKDATYLGYKVGRPNNFHGHMDIGSFYLESQGVRWSVDLGSDHYGDIAKAKVPMFDMKQESPRWTVLTKYNNMAHSTLTLNNAYQKVDGQCDFTAWNDADGDMWAEADLTPVYVSEAKRVERRVALRSGDEVVVEDRLASADKAVKVVWNMTTPAALRYFDREKSAALLSALDENGLERMLRVEFSFGTDADYDFSFIPARSRNSYENPNTGISFMKVTYTVSAHESQRFTIRMTPAEADNF